MPNALNNSESTFSPKEALVIIGLLLIGMYTALAVPVGGFYLPFIIILLVTGYLILFRFGALTGTDLLFLIGSFGILVANSLISAAGLDYITDKYKAIFQIMCGLGVGVFTVHLVRAAKVGDLLKLLLGASGAVLILAVFERLDVTRELSNTWRELAYTGVYTNAYDNEVRDMEMAGYIRPKVFTAEPAFVANFLFVALSGATLIAKRILTGFIAIAMAILGFLLIGSPITILAAFAATSITLIRFVRHAHWIGLAVAIVLFALVSAPLPTSITNKFERMHERFEPVLSGKFSHITEGSLRSRLYVPFWIAAPTALEANPWFGVGVGGKEYLSRQIIPGFSSKGAEIGSHEQTLGTNALGNMIATLGLLGLALFAGAFFLYLNGTFPTHSFLFLLPVVLLLFCRGAYETQAFWYSVFFLLALDQRITGQPPAPTTMPAGDQPKLLKIQ